MEEDKMKKLHRIRAWGKLQADIEFGNTKRMGSVYNNSIYFAYLGEGVGSEQSGERPVLVVDSYGTSSVCIIIPMTLERLEDEKPYHVDLECGVGTVLVEQIRAISKYRIHSGVKLKTGGYAYITEDERDAINKQLLTMCQLKPLYKKIRNS